MKNTFQSERLGITILKHGEMVWENSKKLILGRFEGFRLPEWFIQNHHFIVNNLHDWETIKMYNIYHDCGKPYCRIVDEDGRVHFPNHADKSKEIFAEYFPAFPEVAELIGLDMLMHTSNSTQIAESTLPIKILITLLVTAFAEIHANAEMFGDAGIESTSFKIKYKNLDRIGKKIVEKVIKHSEAYMYVFVRQDIPDAHKVVQAGHAIFEQAKTETKHPSFVVLGVHDEEDLKNTMAYLLDNEVNFKIFREPMPPYNGEITAICAELLVGDQRKLLKEFTLLRI